MSMDLEIYTPMVYWLTKILLKVLLNSDIVDILQHMSGCFGYRK